MVPCPLTVEVGGCCNCFCQVEKFIDFHSFQLTSAPTDLPVVLIAILFNVMFSFLNEALFYFMISELLCILHLGCVRKRIYI